MFISLVCCCWINLYSFVVIYLKCVSDSLILCNLKYIGCFYRFSRLESISHLFRAMLCLFYQNRNLIFLTFSFSKMSEYFVISKLGPKIESNCSY